MKNMFFITWVLTKYKILRISQEFTMLSRRYESVSPVADHPCPRYETDLMPPSTHCRPLSSSPGNLRRFDDSGLDEHFDDDFDILKKKPHF